MTVLGTSKYFFFYGFFFLGQCRFPPPFHLSAEDGEFRWIPCAQRHSLWVLCATQRQVFPSSCDHGVYSGLCCVETQPPCGSCFADGDGHLGQGKGEGRGKRRNKAIILQIALHSLLQGK